MVQLREYAFLLVLVSVPEDLVGLGSNSVAERLGIRGVPLPIDDAPLDVVHVLHGGEVPQVLQRAVFVRLLPWLCHGSQVPQAMLRHFPVSRDQLLIPLLEFRVNFQLQRF